jgi:hypothetical protein
MNNWINNNSSEPSSYDKIKELLKQPYKLVLVQQHELERLRDKSLHTSDINYIYYLFNHYIIDVKNKTYLY